MPLSKTKDAKGVNILSMKNERLSDNVIMPLKEGFLVKKNKKELPQCGFILHVGREKTARYFSGHTLKSTKTGRRKKVQIK